MSAGWRPGKGLPWRLGAGAVERDLIAANSDNLSRFLQSSGCTKTVRTGAEVLYSWGQGGLTDGGSLLVHDTKFLATAGQGPSKSDRVAIQILWPYS